MKRMICTALTALLLVGAPMAVFAQAEGSGAPAAAEAAPKKEHKKTKKKHHHHKKAKSTKGKAKEKPAETGTEMK